MSILVAAMIAAEILAPPPQAAEVVAGVTGEDVAALWKEATGQDVTIKVHEQAVEIEVPIAAPNRARIWLNNCPTDAPKVCSRITFAWVFELGDYEKAGEMASSFGTRRYLSVRRGGGQVAANRLENLTGGVTRENLRGTFRRVAAEMSCGEDRFKQYVNRTEPMYSGPPTITSEPYRDRCAGE